MHRVTSASTKPRPKTMARIPRPITCGSQKHGRPAPKTPARSGGLGGMPGNVDVPIVTVQPLFDVRRAPKALFFNGIRPLSGM